MGRNGVVKPQKRNLPWAGQTHQGIRLAQALVEALRKAKIILPAVPVLERLWAEVVVRIHSDYKSDA